MPKRINFQLSTAEVSALEQAIKTDKRAGVSRRATAVRVLHLGQSVPEAAVVVSASEPSLYQWHARFRAQGIEGLVNQPKPVSQRKVTAEYRRRLEAALQTEPHVYGYSFAIWTRQRLVAHLASETGIWIDVSWMQQLLKQLDYVCRRPKHDLRQRQDIAAKNNAQAELEALKKTADKTSTGFSLWTKRA